ncbi:MAG: uroporphyrinogen-III synthase [Bryobacteraceae bacterium]|jgi:uroporphyrinogen-III synthase
MSFQGMRVVAFESRRAAEIAELVRKQGGQPFVAPAMREAPVEDSAAAFAFAERLFAGEFDTVILLTGAGTRQLRRLLESRYPEGAFTDGLRRVTLVARGPKPVAALREMGLTPAIVAPEPNTWRELLAATANHTGRRIAVQEYGRSNPELLAALAARGTEVTPVRVYRYDLPENAEPLQEAAHSLAAGEFQAALFTTAVQIEHLARVAAELGIEAATLEGLRKCLVGSIGPITSEALEEFGIHPNLEPSHPKMGLLVMETAARAGQ